MNTVYLKDLLVLDIFGSERFNVTRLLFLLSPGCLVLYECYSTVTMDHFSDMKYGT